MKTKLSLILSSIAIVISIITICLALPRREMSIDYLSLITGILGVLVTVLIGWNIYMIIDFRQEKENLKQYFEEQKTVRSVDNELLATYKNQLSNAALLEKSIHVQYWCLQKKINYASSSFYSIFPNRHSCRLASRLLCA